jgi:hypothetical protein
MIQGQRVVQVGLLLLTVVSSSSAFDITVKTDRRQYQPGEEIEASWIACNIGDEVATLSVSSCQSTLVLTDLLGSIVNYVPSECPWNIPSPWSFEPYECLTLSSFPLDLGSELLSPGLYRASVWFPEIEGYFHSRVFEICPQQGCEPALSYIPAVANTPGRNGTIWRTDLDLVNLSPVDATVEIALLVSRQANLEPALASFSLQPEEHLHLEDVMDLVFAASGTGALRIVTRGGAVHATSYTYTTGENGVYGQQVPSVAPESALLPHVETRIGLPGLGDPESEIRTNIGFLNLNAGEVSLALFLEGATGDTLEFNITLKPYEHRQIGALPFSEAELAASPTWDLLISGPNYARTYLVYRSVIDNQSGDARFELAVQ